MKKLLFFAILIVGLCLQANAQERVYMSFFEVMNMHPDYQYSTSKLFKTYVDSRNKYQIILPEKYDSSSIFESFEQAKNNALLLNCPYFIRGEFNRFGDLVVITISMYNSSNEEKIWQNISKALTPDDIDPLMEKLSLTLGQTNSGEGGDIYNVTNYDSKELNKINGNQFFGLTIGGGFVFDSEIEKFSPAGFGVVGSYDMRSIIFNIKGELYFSDINISYMNIDVMYPFSSGKNTSFVSGAMGYGGIKKKYDINPYDNTDLNEFGRGLLLFAGGGYLFNRNSNVSLRCSGNLFVPLFKVGESFPAGILFNTTLLFGK